MHGDKKFCFRFRQKINTRHTRREESVLRKLPKDERVKINQRSTAKQETEHNGLLTCCDISKQSAVEQVSGRLSVLATGTEELMGYCNESLHSCL